MGGIKTTPMTMGEDQVPCPACGTPGYLVNGNILRCTNCGMGWMKEADRTARIAELRAAANLEKEGAFAPSSEGERNHKKVVARRIATAYNAWAGRGDTLDLKGACFEVGTGNAHILEGFKELGWVAAGCDASVRAVDHAAKELGLPVIAARFDRLHHEDGRLEDHANLDDGTPSVVKKDFYDLVVAWDSMEHMDDLRKALVNAASILKPGGILALHSPDFDKYYHDPSHPHMRDRSHLWHMTPQSMKHWLPSNTKLLRTERGTVWGDPGHAHPDNFVAWIRRTA